jgi:hypothetical protein
VTQFAKALAVPFILDFLHLIYSGVDDIGELDSHKTVLTTTAHLFIPLMRYAFHLAPFVLVVFCP